MFLQYAKKKKNKLENTPRQGIAEIPQAENLTLNDEAEKNVLIW